MSTPSAPSIAPVAQKRKPPYDYSCLPSMMRPLEQFVVWRLEPGKNKDEKVPYDPRTHTKARANDPDTWAPLADALTAYHGPRRYAGIGFELRKGRLIFFVDLDHCIDEEGQIAPWALDTLSHFKNTYVEVSVSGTGLHIIGLGTLPPELRKRADNVEIYRDGRFCALTGQLLAGHPAELGDCQEALEWLYAETFGEQKPAAQVMNSHNLPAPIDVDDEELIEKAKAARNGAKFCRLWNGDASDYDGDESDRDAGLAEMLAFWTRKDPERIDRLFRQSGCMRDKWANRADYRKLTIDYAIGKCQETYNGYRPIAGGSGETDTAIAEAPPTVDVSALVAENKELRQLLAEAMHQLNQVKEILLAEREVRHLAAAIQGNRDLGSAGRAAIALRYEEISAQSRGGKDVDEQGRARINRTIAANAAGMSPGTFSTKLGELESWGMLERETTWDRRPKVDKRTGEIIEGQFEFIPTLWVKTIPDMLCQLVDLHPPRVDAEGNPKAQWGGPRPRCKDHPDAPVSVTCRCSQCGKLLGTGTIEGGEFKFETKVENGEDSPIGRESPDCGEHRDLCTIFELTPDPTANVQGGEFKLETNPPAEPATCMDCGAPLPAGNKYRCNACIPVGVT